MQVSIVIPTCGRRSSLRATIQSCLHQTLSPERYEIIVVANPPNRAIQELLKELRQTLPGAPGLRYVPCKQTGAGVARNSGLRAANGKILYLLDDDCQLVARDHLERVLCFHEKQPELTGVGGICVSPEGASWACRYYNALLELWLYRNRALDGSQNVLLGGNASYKHEIIEDDFLFNEEWSYGGVETELNQRLAA
ncbi:MAG: glycosyltransferase family 2 protein, partial [Planctomycetota bacterium]